MLESSIFSIRKGLYLLAELLGFNPMNWLDLIAKFMQLSRSDKNAKDSLVNSRQE